jgi:hypothetical protein
MKQMYLTDIHYEPIIMLKENGEHFPMLRILDLGVPKMLEMLGADEMQSSLEVEKTIDEIKSAVEENSEESSYVFRRLIA